jgi:hypothetical protein
MGMIAPATMQSAAMREERRHMTPPATMQSAAMREERRQ